MNLWSSNKGFDDLKISPHKFDKRRGCTMTQLNRKSPSDNSDKKKSNLKSFKSSSVEKTDENKSELESNPFGDDPLKPVDPLPPFNDK
jgi:hypothetical protein